MALETLKMMLRDIPENTTIKVFRRGTTKYFEGQLLYIDFSGNIKLQTSNGISIIQQADWGSVTTDPSQPKSLERINNEEMSELQ